MSISEKLEKIKGPREEREEGYQAFWRPEKLLERNTFVGLVVLLAAFSSFALGRLSAVEANRSPVKILFPKESTGNVPVAAAVLANPPPDKQNLPSQKNTISTSSPKISPPPVPVPTSNANVKGMYVGSKSGTKYHLPWCGGAKRIKEENKIWFGTKAEAEKKGYTPAANCKGI